MSSAPAPVSRRTVIKAVVASTIGTTIEWYDFFLYGMAAALVFPTLFFPEADAFTGQILAFGTFTVGFLARPLGGIVFGSLGDRLGRKAALVITLLLMGISTMAIGLLPTYHHIGLAAPLMLAALRFMQGLAVGGEWGGAVLLALEFGHRGRRGFIASWPQAGVPLGLLASTGMLALCQEFLTPEAFLAWGWRIPFLLSGLLSAVGLVFRAQIGESPLFADLRAKQQLAQAPVRESLRSNWREILLVAGMRVAENACFYLFTAAAVVYGRDVLKVASGLILGAVNVAAAVAFVTIPLFGALSDRWSRRGAYMTGCVLLLLFAFPFYALLETRTGVWIYLAIVVAIGGIHALLYSVQASFIPELFDTRLRCTSANLGYQLAAPFAGGLAPLVSASLTMIFPGELWPHALYVVVLALISLLCVQRLAETGRKTLE